MVDPAEVVAVAVAVDPAAEVVAADGVETGIAAAGVVDGRKVAIATNPWRCCFMISPH